MTWDQIVILIFGPAGVLLALSRRPGGQMWAPVSGAIGQIGWWYALFHSSPLPVGGLLASLAYSYSWGLGLWIFRKEYVCLFRQLIDLFTSSWTDVDFLIENSQSPRSKWVCWLQYNSKRIWLSCSSPVSTMVETVQRWRYRNG